MSELIEELRKVAGKFERIIFNHPQYIEGTLYVNQDQYNTLWQMGNEERIPLKPPPPLVSGIPVVLVKESDRITLPSGKILMYSKMMESFFVFDADAGRVDVDSYKTFRLG